MARASKPKPTTVVFVRHGRTATTGKVLPGRAKGLHLSDEGKAQAKIAAERIGKDFGATALYTSPLERARETAAPIARSAGLKAITCRGLLECDFGDWTGEDLKKLNKLPEWTSVLRSPSRFRFPNGESFLEMQARVVDTVQTLTEEHPGETVVAVSHADPIKVAIVSALNSPVESMHNIDITPCSISAISYAGTASTVLMVNSTNDCRVTR